MSSIKCNPHCVWYLHLKYVCIAVEDGTKVGCVTGRTYVLKRYKFSTVKKGKLQYIFRQAFDHLPCIVPRNSVQTDAECTTVVKTAFAKVYKCYVDNCFCGCEN
jgi:hypothetical protein